jgi:hypothetical protein
VRPCEQWTLHYLRQGQSCDTYSSTVAGGTLVYVPFELLIAHSQPTVRGQLKSDGTRAETRFRLSAKRTSPFKSAVASVQSTTGSRGVRINSSNAGYTMFRGSVKSTGYPFPFTSPPVRHRVPSHFNWNLLQHGLSGFAPLWTVPTGLKSL